jgi:3-oxoacyl-[acyl-carrier-protein] synthase-1/3-oxoacyl-[acyl-carrier-protein] synthase II
MITPLGDTMEKTMAGLRQKTIPLRPLDLFFHPNPPLVGQADLKITDPGLPRTHGLAGAAALQAVAGVRNKTVDAVVMGVTTGGMPETEKLLKNNITDPKAFKFHGLETVTRHVAAICGCKGPIYTVSTACSSGAAAIALGAKLIEYGLAKCVIAGGADALCRLTCHGFSALQLTDPSGAMPFDKDRKGMHLSEGAAMVILQGETAAPSCALARLAGAGLSCDAHHATSPDPEGRGAARAMEKALEDAGLYADQIDYINLHGTGTIANDAAEAQAVKKIFKSDLPFMSSVKGATGHSLAAAGAIEAALCAAAVSRGFVFANHGMKHPDQKLAINPATTAKNMELKNVLSNSFGFGGNNASLAISHVKSEPGSNEKKLMPMGILTGVCRTGAGGTKASFEAFSKNLSCAGMVPDQDLTQRLDPKFIRRIKRLSKMVLGMSKEAVFKTATENCLSDIFFGTGWGPLSETNDFLTRLYANQEKLSSPIDFAGSVHNAPAGQAAVMLGAKGANMTLTGENNAFEQALAAACLMATKNNDSFLVLGADEAHSRLTPLFDRSVSNPETLCDGGGGFLLTRRKTDILVRPVFINHSRNPENAANMLIHALGGARAISQRFGALFAGLPAANESFGRLLISHFKKLVQINLPVVDYRKYTGRFASASAVAAGLALGCMQQGFIPAGPAGPEAAMICRKGILMINAGRSVTGLEMFRS